VSDFGPAKSAMDVMDVQTMMIPYIGERGAAILGAWYGGAPSRDYDAPLIGFLDATYYAEDAGKGLPFLPDDKPGFFEDADDRGVKYYLAKLAEKAPSIATGIETGAEFVTAKKEKADTAQALQDLSDLPANVGDAIVTGAAAAGQTAASAAGAVLDPLAKTAGNTIGSLVESSGAAWMLLLLIVAALVALRAGVI